MTNLVVVDLTPIDKDKMAQYSALAAETLTPFNGNFIAKGEVDVLSGEVQHKLKVVIQFPNIESAKAWYKSEAYQAIIPLREEAMKSQFHLI
ncbi:DUF1330 domain-containing protein [Glaciecola sp. KUL10]|uniref:DUF1330 domain-containing protein n=1 Tax=Glaciecola sp. (strain KUL10) TaxID=2161813 RepID=UPI000D786268|nr:DUF1330 domain-containing protein [Glaciecola sp. KUL10]GBL05266.1 hypothetical protein KUL10_25860 [Glaciecola sp. KUL10]